MKAKILIADDEFMTVTELEELLPAMGYQVAASAYSGDEALKLAEVLKPDLVLMDIVMPGRIDGITAAEEITGRLAVPVLSYNGGIDPPLLPR